MGLLYNSVFHALIFAVIAVGSVSSQSYRPCDIRDISCIAETMQNMTGCSTLVEGRVPDPYFQMAEEFDAPAFNVTFIDRGRETSNLQNCYFTEFFVNDETKAIVFTIDCPDLSISTTRRVYQHKPLMEDTYYTAAVQGTYELIRFTTYLRGYAGYNLCDPKTGTSAYITSEPSYSIQSFDNATAEYVNEDAEVILDNLGVYASEEFLHYSKSYVLVYLTSVVCDFKCQY